MLPRLARALVHLLVGFVATSKRVLYDPIANWWLSWAELWVSTSEESTKSVIRESFAVLVRVINGAAAWFVSLFFDRSYYARLRRNLTRPNPWSTWWDNDCNSTFNALIERDYTTTHPTQRDSTSQPNGTYQQTSSISITNYHPQIVQRLRPAKLATAPRRPPSRASSATPAMTSSRRKPAGQLQRATPAPASSRT